MKMLRILLVATFAFICETAFATDNISVDKIEIYTDKSKIPYIGNDGWAIPSGVKVAVLRTNNPSYAGWKFVAYGDSLNEMLSLWLSARALGKSINCINEDRGNYWVQCVGITF